MKKLLGIILLLLFASPAFGAVAIDQSTANNDTTGGASITTSFTCTSGASGIIVRISTFDNPNTTASVTYNGTSGTKRAEGSNIVASGSSAAIIWTLLGTGCDGSAHNLVVNFSPNSPFGAYIRIDSVTGADTGTFVGTGKIETYVENSSSPLSDSITVGSGSLVFDCIESNITMTVSGGSTQDYNTTWGGDRVSGSELLNASAMAWTFTPGAGSRIAHAAVEIKPAGAATAAPRRRVIQQ